MELTKATEIGALRSRIARVHGADRREAAISFGLPAIDNLLPGKGLRSALHEVAGAGPETEHGAAPALFVAGVLARCGGAVLWVQEWPDLFAAALAARSLAGVVEETTARVTLTASRRLHLAAETSGVPAFLLRRSRRPDDPRLSEPNAATTRWRITPLPSPAPVPHAPAVAGLVHRFHEPTPITPPRRSCRSRCG